MKNFKSILEISFGEVFAQGWCHNTNISKTRCGVWFTSGTCTVHNYQDYDGLTGSTQRMYQGTARTEVPKQVLGQFAGEGVRGIHQF